MNCLISETSEGMVTVDAGDDAMERLESLTPAGNCVDRIGFRVCPFSPVT